MSGKLPKAGRLRASLSLPKVEEFSSHLRTMLINIGFFAATILLIPAVAGQFTRSAVVIEPIAVPAALAKRGLTPEVVANRVWDGLQAFAQSASAARDTIVAIPDSQLIEFSLPDSGISIDSLFAQVRQFFNIYETRISGEFLCATATCETEGLRLRLRVIRDGSDIVDLPPVGTQTEQDYYREAAAGVFSIIDPYVAIAAQAESAPLRAATLARGLIADGARDAKWAHNLIGDIERKGGDIEIAVAEYQAALALDPDFGIARANLALALAQAGKLDDAKASLAELERRAPGNTLAPKNYAAVAMMEGNNAEAVRYLLIGAEREPLEPGHLAAAGKLELEMGNFDQAVTHLNEALSIDPGHSGALNELAEALWNHGDTAGAERLYRQWLDYDPENLEARTQLAMILFSSKQYEQAVTEFDAILAAAPGAPDAATYRAASLYQLKRYADAIAGFETLVGTSDQFAVFQLLSKSYQAVGRRQDAITTLETYLAQAAPEDPNKATAEAALKELRGDSQR